MTDLRRSLRPEWIRRRSDLMQISVTRDYNIGDVLKHALPQDFVKFGLIPEFIGRVPVTVSLDMLDRDALIRILQEPKMR